MGGERGGQPHASEWEDRRHTVHVEHGQRPLLHYSEHHHLWRWGFCLLVVLLEGGLIALGERGRQLLGLVRLRVGQRHLSELEAAAGVKSNQAVRQSNELCAACGRPGCVPGEPEESLGGGALLLALLVLDQQLERLVRLGVRQVPRPDFLWLARRRPSVFEWAECSPVGTEGPALRAASAKGARACEGRSAPGLARNARPGASEEEQGEGVLTYGDVAGHVGLDYPEG